jgi:hypothetical protein
MKLLVVPSECFIKQANKRCITVTHHANLVNAMATWRKDHLELLFLCQSFNNNSDIGKTAKSLNLSLNADSRARISHLVRHKNGLDAQAEPPGLIDDYTYILLLLY